MQLTANGAHMVVDFYPVKYSDGTISERLMYKTVTFCDKMQSKSYINKVSFEKEVENRVEGYKYEVTDMHTRTTTFQFCTDTNSLVIMSLIKTYLHTLQMNNQLEMLSQREQLMEDIENIVDEMCGKGSEELVALLCDAVCTNFPTN